MRSRTFRRRPDGSLACEECEGGGSLTSLRGDVFSSRPCPDCDGTGSRPCQPCGGNERAEVAVTRTSLTGRRYLSLECAACAQGQAEFEGALPEMELSHV